MEEKDLKKMAGHRGRLRKRFLQGGLDSFLDYEIVELLLTLGTPRKDCKQAAKDAIKKFKGLRGVLDASLEELRKIKGIGSSNVFGLKLFQAMSERYEREKLLDKITLNSPKLVARYLQKNIGYEKKEKFVILSLNKRNNLIKISIVSVGSLDTNVVHPREVFREAIQCSAAGVILAHNHPSGNIEPSQEDLALTKRIRKAGEVLGIDILDHIVVSSRDFYSFKENNLI
jgi:DNA repair protein RadC